MYRRGELVSKDVRIVVHPEEVAAEEDPSAAIFTSMISPCTTPAGLAITRELLVVVAVVAVPRKAIWAFNEKQRNNAGNRKTSLFPRKILCVLNISCIRTDLWFCLELQHVGMGHTSLSAIYSRRTGVIACIQGVQNDGGKRLQPLPKNNVTLTESAGPGAQRIWGNHAQKALRKGISQTRV